MHYNPYPYQRMAIQHILDRPGSGVYLDMGMGKTSITLSAILAVLYDSFECTKVLVIAPKKVAEATWQEEARQWDCFRTLTFSAILGDRRQRITALNRRADVYMINRENVVWLMEQCHNKPPFDMLVIDESTSFKDQGTKRWRALRRVRKCFKKIVILTGTPSPNSLMDLWAQIYLLDGGERLGRTITEYRQNYFIPDKRDGMRIFSYKIKSPQAEKEIYDKISDICISLRAKDYLALPETMPPVVVPVKLSPADLKTYKELEREQMIELKGQEITAMSAAAVSTKLLQLANGAVYDADGRTLEVHPAKLEALQEIAESNEGSPVLVFYSFRSDLARIQRAFPQARKLETAQDIKDWNAGKVPMLLAHPASAGYGLNLQAGGHIIVWYGLTWSLEQYQQANARLKRQGQTRPVVICHLVAEGTIDERVMRVLKHKESGQEAMMQAIRVLVKEAEK